MSNKTFSVLYSVDHKSKTFRSTARDLNKSKHWVSWSYQAGVHTYLDKSQSNQAQYVLDADGLTKREAERYQWAKNALLESLGYSRAVATLK